MLKRAPWGSGGGAICRDKVESMQALGSISDADLLARMPSVVVAERAAVADVIEHLMEIDKRRLYLAEACSSLYAYCLRLGYSEEAALKRVRVTRLIEQLPRLLGELRTGAVHLTALFLLSKYLTPDNCEALLAEVRGKSRRELERVIARWFPRPDAPQHISPIAESRASAESAPLESSGPRASSGRPETGEAPASFKLEPLSPSSYRIQFRASAELYTKIERARELLSHVLPTGDLAALFERALDELIERETKRRVGAERPRKRRQLGPGSRHIPVEVRRAVWERDAGQCAFISAEGRRCSERRFLTLEHRHPFALGGPPTVENICLLCASHNASTARRVFGEAHIASRIDSKRREGRKQAQRAADGREGRRQPEPTGIFAKLLSALQHMGFRRPEVTRVIAELRTACIEPELEPLMRAALLRLAPAPA